MDKYTTVNFGAPAITSMQVAIVLGLLLFSGTVWYLHSKNDADKRLMPFFNESSKRNIAYIFLLPILGMIAFAVHAAVSPMMGKGELNHKAVNSIESKWQLTVRDGIIYNTNGAIMADKTDFSAAKFIGTMDGKPCNGEVSVFKIDGDKYTYSVVCGGKEPRIKQ